MMNGQTQVISAVLITGVLITVIGTVYLWGLPLIQKNEAVSVLYKSEDFMRSLNTKIKSIVNNGGKDNLRISVPGVMVFDQTKGLILVVNSQGTIYATGGQHSLGRNGCAKTTGIFGQDEPEVLCVNSTEFDKTRYQNIYTLKYIPLVADVSGGGQFLINLTGKITTAGENHFIVIENMGVDETSGTRMAIIDIKFS